jgi:hypothetical protein
MSRTLLVLSGLFVPSIAYAQAAPAPAAEPAPPAAAPAEPAAAAPPAHSWFWRPPLEFKVGEGDQKWTTQLYGFAELDMITDSTRSFNESEGQGAVVRNTVFEGQNGRTQFTARNSRLGIKLSAPTIDGIKATGLIEMDFFGNQPASAPNATAYGATGGPGSVSEANFLVAGVGRLRHAWLKLEDDIINVMAGQNYIVFGGDSYFFPATTEFLPMVGMVFQRTTQFRLWKTIKTDPVNVDIVVAAMRPPQRDSQIPEGQGQLAFKINNFKALHTPGACCASADPAAISVSGTVRKFKVNSIPAAVPPKAAEDTGWGVAVNGLIPIIPAENSDDRSNKLTLTGSFVTGSGYGDVYNGLTGGLNGVTPAAVIPATPAVGAPLPAEPSPAQGDIDTGMVAFDPAGNLHTINWTSFQAGLQYYLPGGRFLLAALVSHAYSNNIVGVRTNGGGGGSANAGTVWKEGLYVDASLMADITPNARVGLTGSRTITTYGDDLNQANNSNNVVYNNRGRLCFYYFF